jgi:hypothetical protein
MKAQIGRGKERVIAQKTQYGITHSIIEKDRGDPPL